MNFIERPKEKDNFRGPKFVERLWYEWCYNWISNATNIKHATNATPPNMDSEGNVVSFGSFLKRSTNDCHFKRGWQERGRNSDTAVVVEQTVLKCQNTRDRNVRNLAVSSQKRVTWNFRVLFQRVNLEWNRGTGSLFNPMARSNPNQNLPMLRLW